MKNVHCTVVSRSLQKQFIPELHENVLVKSQVELFDDIQNYVTVVNYNY